MSYEYDVFISYSRHGEWPEWVQELFRPLFAHWLAEDLGRTAEIFVDNDIAEGDTWPHELARVLASSRILVALWTPMYFSSKWCKSELAHMYAREKKCGYRAGRRSGGLIIPAALHGDGENFPREAKIIQMAQLQEYANVSLPYTFISHFNIDS